MTLLVNGITIPNAENGLTVLVALDHSEEIMGPVEVLITGGCLVVQSEDGAAVIVRSIRDHDKPYLVLRGCVGEPDPVRVG